MIPEYPKFKKLDFEDRAALKKALKEVSPGICELALGNIYIWQNFDRDEITCLNGNLCLRINPLKEPAFFLEPFGTKQANHTVDQLLMDGHRLSRFS